MAKRGISGKCRRESGGRFEGLGKGRGYPRGLKPGLILEAISRGLKARASTVSQAFLVEQA